MKLIDILARELKVWPEGPVIVYHIGLRSRSLRITGYDVFGNVVWQGENPNYPIDPDLDFEEIVSRVKWQAARDALSEKCEHSHGNDRGCPECGEEFAPAWNGKGLPPVGICEFRSLTRTNGEWTEVEVVGHFKAQESMVAAYVPLHGLRTVGQAIAECFRPIRTAEQIAAEERAKEINRLSEITGLTVGAYKTVFEAIIDSHYRKQVAK